MATIRYTFRRSGEKYASTSRLIQPARAKKAKREHAQYRNLKNFYFDDVTKTRRFLSDRKRILCAFQTVNLFENWHIDRIFFFSPLEKNHQISYIRLCNTRQKRKLRIPPKIMYRFSCTFAS